MRSQPAFLPDRMRTSSARPCVVREAISFTRRSDHARLPQRESCLEHQGGVMSADLIHQLKSFNLDRDPELVQLKYQKMRGSAFAFLRGTCHLFYADQSGMASLNAAPLAWICGDLH